LISVAQVQGNTFGRGVTILTPFLALALFRSYGIRGVLGMMTGFLVLQMLVVLRFGIAPKKRRLEDME
jgi:putative MFS transporter